MVSDGACRGKHVWTRRGVLHHVIIRGIERRRKIFFDKLAKHLAMTGPGVGYAVSRGERVDRVIYLFTNVPISYDR